MAANSGSDRTVGSILVVMAAFVIVVAGMRAASPIMVTLLLSLFIAMIAAPPMFWLRDRGLPVPLALLVVILSIAGIGFLLGVVIGNSINDFSSNLPQYQTRLQAITGEFITWLSAFGIDISNPSIRDQFDPGKIMQLAASMLSGLGNALTNAFLILITVIFMLFEASSLPAKLRAAIANPESPLKDLKQFNRNINRYIALKSVVSLVTGLTVAIWLFIIKVDYPLLWGLLAFFFNFVPNIGSIIAAIPAVLLALIQYGVGTAAAAAAGFLVINIVMGNFIEPRFVGRGLGMSPLVVFLSLVFWGWVLGPVGMLLSVPLTMTLQIALGSHANTRWIAILLGPEIREDEQKENGDQAEDTG